MEYSEIAEELMSLAASLSHLPASRAVWEASGGEYSALVYILDSARGAHPTELCRYMSVSSARISAMLRDLENKHWVVRKKDPADERSKLVFLTEAGRQFITERRGAVLRRLEEMLECLGPEDAAEYLRLQRKLAQGLAPAAARRTKSISEVSLSDAQKNL